MSLNSCRLILLWALLLLTPAVMQAQKGGGGAARSAPAPAPRATAAPRQNTTARPNAQARQNVPARQNTPVRQPPQGGRQFGNNNQTRLPNNGPQRSFNSVSRPRGPVSRLPGGGSREVRANGAVIDRNASGHTTGFSVPNRGLSVRTNPNTGAPTRINSMRPGNSMVIHRGPMNERRIERVRSVPGGVERISHYGNWSSVQRPIVGRPGYVQRTVFTGGRSYSVVYHSYGYHGVMLYSPVPAIMFAPAYYGFLLSPWGAPVAYPPAFWGWPGQPWYAAYGPVFTPYPVYASPDQWLTDYLISSNLQHAYENRQALAGQSMQPMEGGGMPVISEEEKAIINQDVRDEIARQQQFATNPGPPVHEQQQQLPPQPGPTEDGAARNQPPPPGPVPEALKDRAFSVYVSPLEVQQVSGETCALAEGDLLIRTGNEPNADNTVDVVVRKSHASASHPEYCPQQTQARVQLSDLQEMYNHKKELLAEGMKQQATLMGRRLPKGPAPQPTPVPHGQVDPDTAAAVAELKQMMQDADNTEKEVSVVATTSIN